MTHRPLIDSTPINRREAVTPLHSRTSKRVVNFQTEVEERRENRDWEGGGEGGLRDY